MKKKPSLWDKVVYILILPLQVFWRFQQMSLTRKSLRKSQFSSRQRLRVWLKHGPDRTGPEFSCIKHGPKSVNAKTRTGPGFLTKTLAKKKKAKIAKITCGGKCKSRYHQACVRIDRQRKVWICSQNCAWYPIILLTISTISLYFILLEGHYFFFSFSFIHNNFFRILVRSVF
jgi:hypothetical protein